MKVFGEKYELVIWNIINHSAFKTGNPYADPSPLRSGNTLNKNTYKFRFPKDSKRKLHKIRKSYWVQSFFLLNTIKKKEFNLLVIKFFFLYKYVWKYYMG